MNMCCCFGFDDEQDEGVLISELELDLWDKHLSSSIKIEDIVETTEMPKPENFQKIDT